RTHCPALKLANSPRRPDCIQTPQECAENISNAFQHLLQFAEWLFRTRRPKAHAGPPEYLPVLKMELQGKNVAILAGLPRLRSLPEVTKVIRLCDSRRTHKAG